MKINNNISAVITNKHLLRTEDTLADAMERLSSGIQINHAGDDPSGIAIASKMQTQIDGLDQASQNASDGMSVLESADGALNEVMDMLQRMRELSIQASNGLNSVSDREAIQAEIDQLRDEVNRVSSTTEFNTKNLLDGSLDKRVYAKGVTRVQISDEVPEGIYKFTINKLPENATLEFPTDFGTLADNMPEDCVMTINGSGVNITGSMGRDALYTALREAAEIGGAEITDKDVTTDNFKLSSIFSGSDEQLLVNISDYRAANAMGFDTSWAASPSVEAIDTAVYDGETMGFGTDDSDATVFPVTLDKETTLTLNRNKVILPAGTYSKDDFIGALKTAEVAVHIPDTATESEKAALEEEAFLEDKVVIYEDTTTGTFTIKTAPADNSTELNIKIHPASAANTLGFDGAPDPDNYMWAVDPEKDGGRIYLRSGDDGDVTLNQNTGSAFSKHPQATVTYNGDRFSITDTKGFDMNMMFDKETIEEALAADPNALPYSVELDITEIGPMNLQVGANEGQQITVRIPSTSAESMYLDQIDVVMIGGSERSMTILSDAIARLSEIRSDIGAFTNRLEHSVKSLDQKNENMNAAISRLQDTNMAKEMTEYTKLSVLQQAATSALTQANELPSTALQLLG